MQGFNENNQDVDKKTLKGKDAIDFFKENKF
jgi:hypothetical protein